jgi:hypothetical protein
MVSEQLPPDDEVMAYLSHIGAIVSNWAELELMIDASIWRAARIEPEVGGCITANLGSIHSKLKALRALLEWNAVDEKLLKDFNKYQNAISGTADKRNRVVHHPWFTLDDLDGNPLGQFVIRANRNKREFSTPPVSLTELSNIDAEIDRRHEQFEKLHERFASQLPAFDGKQLLQPLA